MALSRESRWVVVGSLEIRPHQKAPSDFIQSYTVSDLAGALREMMTDDPRWYSKNNNRAMWCSHVRAGAGYYLFLFHVANSNAADVAFYNRDTRQPRYIERLPAESDLYSSHVLVWREPDNMGRHLVLIEKVPGVYLATVKAHFGWARDNTQTEHQPQTHLPVFELDGRQSTTVGEALTTGTLKDIEFVRVETQYNDGIDEESSGIAESTHSVSLKPKEDASRGQIHGILSRIRSFKDKYFEAGSETQTYIRIKTDDGQIKRSEIHNTERQAVLAEAFVQNEKLSGFEFDLKTTYTEPSSEMSTKLADLGNRL